MNKRAIGIGAINLYQQHLSPLKGFRCAHSIYHDGISCSEFGKQIIQKYGYLKFGQLMPQRLLSCNDAMKELKKIEKEKNQNSEDRDCFGKTWAGLEAGCCLLTILGS